MTPGEPSIRKVFDKICPQKGGEQIPVWLSRVGRTLGWPTARVTSLYKDRRCRLSDAEGSQLRKGLAGEQGTRNNSQTDMPVGLSQKEAHLRQAIANDADTDRLIKELADDIASQTLRRFAESILESLPRVPE